MMRPTMLTACEVLLRHKTRRPFDEPVQHGQRERRRVSANEVFAGPICMTVARLSVFVLQYFYDNLTIDRLRRHSCARRSTSGCCSLFCNSRADALTVSMATWPPFRTLGLTLSRFKGPRKPPRGESPTKRNRGGNLNRRHQIHNVKHCTQSRY